MGTFEGNQFKVVSVKVHSSKLAIQPGLRVGMEQHLVRKKLGVPAGESNKDGFYRLHYVNKGNDGFAVFYFKDRVLKWVEWESNLC